MNVAPHKTGQTHPSLIREHHPSVSLKAYRLPPYALTSHALATSTCRVTAYQEVHVIILPVPPDDSVQHR